MDGKPLGPQNDLDERGDPIDPNWSERLRQDMERQKRRVIIPPKEVREWRKKPDRKFL